MEWPAWTAIAALVTLVATLGGILSKYITRLTEAEGAAIAAKRTADQLALEVAKQALETERIGADLVEHRVAVAKEYVSKEALRDSENRILGAIKTLSDRLDSLFRRDT